MRIVIALVTLLWSCQSPNNEKENTTKALESLDSRPSEITFPSLDSLPIYANLYSMDSTAPIIVLCHQARYNKYEYVKIAETLCENGFTCLAIDQRSGGPIVETPNQTMLGAEKLGKAVDFLDAEQDIVAAVDFISAKYNRKVILWGSSYSSTLALFVGMDHKNVAAIVSFSPGDYFIEEKGSLTEKLKSLSKPAFVTSSKEEAAELTKMLQFAPKDLVTQFMPVSDGAHGSRALWKTDKNSEEYWLAINSFLDKCKSINYNR